MMPTYGKAGAHRRQGERRPTARRDTCDRHAKKEVVPIDTTSYLDRECSSRVLLAALGVAAHELIHTTGGIDELALTSIEGV